MTDGPGKYDDLATFVRNRAKAAGAIVIVIDGTKGSGFSVQVRGDRILNLPGILRKVADEIDADTPKA